MALSLSFRFFELPLAHAFTISRYTVTVQKTVVVRIAGDGFEGFGEATVNPYYHSTVERLSASLERVRLIVESAPALDPTDFWNLVSPHLHDDSFALCALDIAYWDWFARKNGRTVRSYFVDPDQQPPLTSYTIALDTLENMKAKILERPWPIYKIKLGKGDDLKIVETLRGVTGAVFRVDANAAWSAQQTIDYAKILQQLDVEFIEQPLRAGDPEMERVFAESVLPAIADESCQHEADVARCAGLFHGINIKLTKCGGITPAVRMIQQARSLDLEVMAGCMTESSIGISGLMQVAPSLDFLDADGALLLAQDIADGVRFDFGKAVYPDRLGTGLFLPVF